MLSQTLLYIKLEEYHINYNHFQMNVTLCWYRLHGLTNSHSFHGLQLFFDLCQQALYILWTVIVPVDLPFEVGPKKFDRPL
jgi:hypothetical protein